MKNTYQKGFTMVEFIIVMGIFAVLMALATVSLSRFERKSSIASVVNSLVADVKQQQIKAMAGDGEGSGAINNYGVHFTSSSYTLFRGTYSAGATDNFTVTLPTNITLSTTFSGSDATFTKGSGEVPAASTITLTDSTNGQTKTVSINKLGVVTGIN